MAQRTQLVYTDNPGGLPATFRLPADLDLELDSVVARISGAAAAAAFVPVLELLSQDGRIMAQVKLEQTLAVGDTARGTWAPFLSRAGASSAGASAFTMVKRSETSFGAAQVVGTGAWVAVDISQAPLTNQDTARFGTVSDSLTTKLAGRYGFLGKVRWDPLFAGNALLDIGASGVWSYWPTVTADLVGPGADNGNVMVIYLESDIPGGTTEWTLHVRQESGVNQTVEGALFQITYLGAFTNPSTAYDDF